MTFECSTPIPNCYLFLFEKEKELSLSFCRVQEFYESPKPLLNNVYFSFDEFVSYMMDDSGDINYFREWTGFNVPGEVYNKWERLVEMNEGSFSKYEYRLGVKLPDNDKTPFYVIGALKDDEEVIEHEIAHALYYLNQDYMNEMTLLNIKLISKYKNEYDKIVAAAYRLGYAEKVISDEIQAYLATSNKLELVDDFDVDYALLKPLIKKYRKVLRKYYNN